MSQPQPYDNSRRVWYVDESHVKRPLVKSRGISGGILCTERRGYGSVERNRGERTNLRSVGSYPRAEYRQADLLVLDKHDSHVSVNTRASAPHQPSFPQTRRTSTPLNRSGNIQVDESPIIVEDKDDFHELVKDVFDQVTQRISFAKDLSEKFLDFQKFS